MKCQQKLIAFATIALLASSPLLAATTSRTERPQGNNGSTQQQTAQDGSCTLCTAVKTVDASESATLVFMREIELQGVVYEAQHLTRMAVDEILDSPMEGSSGTPNGQRGPN